MLETKTQNQGKSVVITLPDAENIELVAGKKYLVTYHENGTIMLTPKIDNPFKDIDEGSFYEADLWEEMTARGGEIIDD